MQEMAEAFSAQVSKLFGVEGKIRYCEETDVPTAFLNAILGGGGGWKGVVGPVM